MATNTQQLNQMMAAKRLSQRNEEYWAWATNLRNTAFEQAVEARTMLGKRLAKLGKHIELGDD